MLNLIYLAKWAGVPAWELAQQPSIWHDMIATAMEIERTIHERGKSHGDSGG